MFSNTILILASLSFSEAKLGTVRKTQYGLVRGKISTSHANSSIQYFSFKSIQYAAPPLGKLRFQEPRPPKPWNNTRCALKHKQICMQFDPVNRTTVIGSEDCLYLDVYIPITAAKNLKKMPVLVDFHQGTWNSGSARPEGPDYFMEKPVIIVQPESRLNIFGFFTLLDDNARGNCGLKDQVLALKWVQTNIEYFGGDPSRVTIFGNSNGGISVIFHMLSPLSKGLFSGGICQSGNPIGGRSIIRNPMEITRKLLEDLDIDSTDNRDIVKQLQAIDAETLFRTAFRSAILGYFTQTDGQFYSAVIEVNSSTSFLSASPDVLLKSGNYTKVPLIMGFVSQEGEYHWSVIENQHYDINEYQDNPRMLLPDAMNIPEDSPCLNRTLNNITRRYFPDRNYTNPNEWIPYSSLNEYVVGILKTLFYLRKEVSIYFYYFSYVGSRNTAFLQPPGVVHNEERLYLWYPQGYGANPNESDADRLTRERMVTIWTNFAIGRNPTPEPEGLLQNVAWPIVGSELSYLNINSTLTIGSPIPNQSEMRFWNRQYQACGFPDPDPNM